MQVGLAGLFLNVYISVNLEMEHPMIALLNTVIYALEIYKWIIIGSAIFSWLYAFRVINTSNGFVNGLGRFFYGVTEPVLRPIRRFLPDLGGVDISPIIVFIAIYFIEQVIVFNIMPLFY
ncbi:MAG: hypothetical protein RIR97_905 [Pseudomonadota bacterium]|jgi:YggT family protein